MGKSPRNTRPAKPPIPKVAVACQGGGMHAAFEVGVLLEILEYVRQCMVDAMTSESWSPLRRADDPG